MLFSFEISKIFDFLIVFGKSTSIFLMNIEDLTELSFMKLLELMLILFSFYGDFLLLSSESYKGSPSQFVKNSNEEKVSFFAAFLIIFKILYLNY